MRPARVLRVVPFAATLVVVLLTTLLSPRAQTAASVVRGVVQRTAETPVADAQVTVFSAEGVKAADVRTDTAGRFEATLMPGKYVVRVAMESVAVADAAIEAPTAALLTITLG